MLCCCSDPDCVPLEPLPQLPTASTSPPQLLLHEATAVVSVNELISLTCFMIFIDFPAHTEDRQGSLCTGSACLSSSIKQLSYRVDLSSKYLKLPKRNMFFIHNKCPFPHCEMWKTNALHNKCPFPEKPADCYKTRLLPCLWKLKQEAHEDRYHSHLVHPVIPHTQRSCWWVLYKYWGFLYVVWHFSTASCCAWC